uniref:Mitochondrial dicarboxylate carrier-like n=1 Tax=Cyprinus carpio TaxID=7962 RepID=A0A8C1IDV9_CYPCA
MSRVSRVIPLFSFIVSSRNKPRFSHDRDAHFALVLRRNCLVRGRLLHASTGLNKGLTGGFIGTPADMVNVRMQNDVKLPPELRRNYAHALDGLLRVWKEEGIRKLFSGASMAAGRGAMVTVGQLSCYDQAKQLVLGTGLMTDNIFTHFVASFIAGGCATVLCQPMDVVKTRLMNSKGEYRGVIHCLSDTGKLGPKAFYKGLVPAGIRLIPHTVLTFIFLEQLRLYFGIRVVTST